MIKAFICQTLEVTRLELRKTFFARRGLWIYLLAFAPILLYYGHSIYAPREQQRLAKIAQSHHIPAETLRSIKLGEKRDTIVGEIGEPYSKRGRNFQMEGGRSNERYLYQYTDGQSDYEFRFVDGVLTRINRADPETLADNNFIFAGIFQLYYLRLAIFFGCLGVFMNLFRGEMLDKSLHFYLMAPLRREALLAGKYLAGLIVTIIIFGAGTSLQFPAMLAQFDHKVVMDFMADPGWRELAEYLGITVLGCVGYGSLFLAAGLLFRNPVIPAAVILLWESASLFLPASLKHLTMIYYLQSLCPVAPPKDPNISLPLTLLISTAVPASPGEAIVGLGLFTSLVLVFAGIKSRKLEINYATD
jgi:ABC-2 family transporter protein